MFKKQVLCNKDGKKITKARCIEENGMNCRWWNLCWPGRDG